MRLHEGYEFAELIRSIEDMALRGLVHRAGRGWELTARGAALRKRCVGAGRRPGTLGLGSLGLGLAQLDATDLAREGLR
jgi:hypothetical protein